MDAVRAGEVEESVVDDKVVRLLCLDERVGRLDRDTASAVVGEDERVILREVGTRGHVLLRNEGDVLPLSDSVRTVALIGPNAVDAHTQGGGSGHVNTGCPVDPAAGLREMLPEHVEVTLAEPGTHRIEVAVVGAHTIRIDDVPILGARPLNGVHDHTEGVFVGHRDYDRDGIEPHRPFGFGPGCTTWRIDDATPSTTGSTTGADGLVTDTPTVTVTLTDTGRRPGRHGVQVYLEPPTDDGPPRSLAAFALGARRAGPDHHGRPRRPTASPRDLGPHRARTAHSGGRPPPGGGLLQPRRHAPSRLQGALIPYRARWDHQARTPPTGAGSRSWSQVQVPSFSVNRRWTRSTSVRGLLKTSRQSPASRSSK